MSLARSFAAVLAAALLTIPIARAQEEKPADDKDKEAVRKLLAKAEDEYRSYFKRPETTFEFWGAIKFEIEVGKFDIAALHLKQLMAKEPAEDVDKDLVRIENAEGMSSFLKLSAIKKWSDHPPFQKEALENVQKLLERVIAAVDKSLSEPARFAKFIPQLDAATEEEREFAFVQLNRSRERAAAYLIDALRNNVGTPLHRRIVEAMVRFDAEMVPGWLEALKAKDRQDAQEADLRLTLLSIVSRRGEKRAVPYLWHMSAAKMYPPQVSATAKVVLAQLTKNDPNALPPAKIALTELSERYAQHKVKFPQGKTVRVWPWDGAKLATKPVELTVRQAEEYYGLRAAREALDLDPAYLPAQMAFLQITLDRAYGSELDQVLLRPMPPSLQRLLGSIDGDLLIRVLERGLDDGNIPVILAATQALGERGEIRAARASVGGAPQGLTRALYYPDRRVQYAAVRALLRIPAPEAPVAATRIVEVLRRCLAAPATPRALIAYVPMERYAEIRPGFKESGFEPVFAKNIKEGLDKLGPAADIDVVFLDGGAIREIPFAIAQLRADADQGNVPIFLLAAKDQEYALRKLAEKYRHVKVVPDGLLMMGEELKNQIEAALADTAGAKITAAERKEFARGAMDYLWRMARNEMQGYDVRPALDAVIASLRNPDTATEALEILGRVPGAMPQTKLAGVALDAGQDKLRIPAAMELNRHVQKYGLMLDRAQVGQLKVAYNSATDPQLKAQLAVTLGALRPSAALTGSRLIEFRPDPPAPPPMPEEKKDEKKEEKNGK